ncbi:hypothetical protein AGMMS49944_29680 [Spirochaetia bacterium]|nr:hypothetical protein AGMMS49944_29680 [Spirochaetia bacterium]
MLLKFAPKNGAHLKVIPLVPVGDAAKKIVLTRSQVNLLPGTNEVTDDEYAVMKPHITFELAKGIIVPVVKKVPGSPDQKNLKDYTAKEAIKLVEDCVNPDTLKKWTREETREEVRAKLARRCEKLKIEITEKDLEDPAAGGDDQGGGDPEGLAAKTVPELKELAETLKIDLVPLKNKADIIAAIETAQAAQGSGGAQ